MGHRGGGVDWLGVGLDVQREDSGMMTRFLIWKMDGYSQRQRIQEEEEV